VAANGERLFVSLLDDGRWLARSFDKAGLPRSRGPGPLRLGAWLDEDGDGSWDDSPAAGAERVDTWTADLDGDGSSEQLTRR
jgi:hypothetical protein